MLAAAGLAQAGYNWYYSDALTAANSAWTQNGSVTYTGSGITSSSGGALVSTQTAPVYTNDYQVQATINLPGNTSGGYYGVMLRASSNAGSGQGTYYLIEIQNPTFSGGACTATLAVTRFINGSSQQLSASSTWCATSFTLGATVNGSTIVVLMNGYFALWTSDSGITTGAPGVSIMGAPSGNTIGLTKLGQGDTRCLARLT